MDNFGNIYSVFLKFLWPGEAFKLPWSQQNWGPSICAYFASDYLWDPNIYHNKKYSVSCKTGIVDKLVGLLVVYWLIENSHCSEL